MSIFVFFSTIAFPDDEYAFERVYRVTSLLHRYVRHALCNRLHSVTARGVLIAVIQRQLERYYQSVEST